MPNEYDGAACQRVAALTREGYTPREIAEKMGITERTVYRHRQRVGIKVKTMTDWTDEDQRRADQLFDDGCSVSEVARTLGRGFKVVQQHCPGRGWTKEQAQEWNSKYWKSLRQQLGLTEPRALPERMNV